MLREPMFPTEALHFGTAVHKGLEAHYRGTDGELVFRRTWRELSESLRNDGFEVSQGLSKIGLDLLEKVVDLNLSGEPEKKIWVRTEDYTVAPILGYADLWDTDTHTIFDFKTTVGAWSEARAEKETWQPCLYSYAYWLETGTLPTFEYIVLNRVSGTLTRFKTRRDHDQIMAALSCIREVALMIKRGEFECRCGASACPECGMPWQHGHMCELGKGTRIRLGDSAA